MSESNRAQEISAALIPAYQNASKLRINKKEAAQLTKEFADKDVEILKDGSLYIPHIKISQRLNSVFSPGSWTLICRQHGMEERNDTLKAEHCLIVRGCFVGESVDEWSTDPMSQARYGDALEATAAKALRKICGKRLGCGAQVWDANYCADWTEKHAETEKLPNGEIAWKKKGTKLRVDFTETPRREPIAPTLTENDRDIMLQLLNTQGKENVLKFAIEKGILKQGQELGDWPLDLVVCGEKEIRALQKEIEVFFNPKKDSTDWRNTIVPISPSYRGKILGDVPKDAIAELWEAFQGNEMKSVGERFPEFKNALDAAGKEFNFQAIKPRKK